jgi:hypothetical protein
MRTTYEVSIYGTRGTAKLSEEEFTNYGLAKSTFHARAAHRINDIDVCVMLCRAEGDRWIVLAHKSTDATHVVLERGYYGVRT